MTSRDRFLSLPVLLAATLSLPGLDASPQDVSSAEPAAATFVPTVRLPRASELDGAQEQARARLVRLRRLLDDQAIGVVLSPALGLAELESALVPGRADDGVTEGARLSRSARNLRQVVPPSLQAAVDDLRAAVDRLARLIHCAADDDGVTVTSLATLARQIATTSRPPSLDDEVDVRKAFASAATRLPDETLAPLRRRLSHPNDVGFVSRSFLAFLARQHVEQPVSFDRQVEGARISGTGRVVLDLSATMPRSLGENRLVLHARGSGTIAATADRRRVHVRATALPSVTCAQTVHILPRTIAGDTPDVSAEFRTKRQGVGIDGVLGRCRVVQRLAGRAIDAVLAANDPRVAAMLEDAVRDRVHEEGLALAYRVNGLLRSTVWDQLRAVDYMPTVELHNDDAGLWSETTYAHADELGALSRRPALPADGSLDVVRWVHESVLTNALVGLTGAMIDEATVRGLWETQFKLWSPDWETLPAGRVPAVIHLADERPVSLRFQPDGVVIDLRTTGCDRDGRRVDTGPRGFRVRYRVHEGATGLALVRDPIECATNVPAEIQPIWEEVLGLFCARDIRPVPRFPNRKARHLLRLAHLHAADGWLVVGLARSPEAVPPADDRRDALDGDEVRR